MKNWLLDYVNCSKVKLIVSKMDYSGKEIYSGVIKCDDKKYYIRRRIPILMDKGLNRILKIRGLYEALPSAPWKASQSDWVRHMRIIHLKMILDGLQNIRNGDEILILALGCGWGWEIWATRYLLNTLNFTSHYKIIGTDIAYKPLKRAKKLANIFDDYRIDFAVAPAEKLLFKNNSFDLVMGLFGVLDHSKFYATIFKEVSRVIKPGGIFLFTVLNKFALDWFFKILTDPKLYLKTIKKAKEPFTRVTIPLKNGGAIRIPTHYYQINELFKSVKAYNFKIIRKYGIFSLLPMNFKLHRFRNYHKLLSILEKKLSSVFPINLLGRYLGLLVRKS